LEDPTGLGADRDDLLRRIRRRRYRVDSMRAPIEDEERAVGSLPADSQLIEPAGDVRR
jgi:hypothetical protein